MKPLKREVQAVADRMVQGHGTPEELAVAVIELIDQLRGDRSHRYAVLQVAGTPIVVGPYSTDRQARSAVEKAAIADKVIWVQDGWTDEGFKAHMAKVDEPPAPHKVNVAEERKLAAAFWGHVSRIKDGEATAIVGHNKHDIEIKPFVLPKGAWG